MPQVLESANNAAEGRLPVLAGTLRRRWRILAVLKSSQLERRYSVEDTATARQAVLIQSTFAAPPQDVLSWKRKFAEATRARQQQSSPSQPRVLDFFTQGDCLYLVEESVSLPPEFEKAQEFLNTFVVCHKTISPFGRNASVLDAQMKRLQDLLESRRDTELENWKLTWSNEALCSCMVVGDWIDEYCEPRVAARAARDFAELLRQAGVEQINPPSNSSVSSNQHDVVGSVPVETPSDGPDKIARVKRHGYRQGGRVVRKAAVIAFKVVEPPPPPISRDQETAREFTSAFEACCDAIRAQGDQGGNLFKWRDDLKAHFAKFPVGLGPGELKTWKLIWDGKALNCCMAVGRWRDERRARTRAEQDGVSRLFQRLLELAQVETIDPATNSAVNPDEHNVAGTLLVASSSDNPGRVGRVQACGYRQGGKVLRKAEILIFERRPPPTPTRRWIVALCFSILVVAGLFVLRWFLGRRGTESPTNTTETRETRSTTTRRTQNTTTKAIEIPVRIAQFAVTPSQVKPGEAVTLSWQVENATEVKISPSPVPVGTSGTFQFVPPPDKPSVNVMLWAKGKGESNSASAQRIIQLLLKPTIEFSGSPEQIIIGQSVRLEWSVTGATRVRIDPGYENLLPQGAVNVFPEVNTEYTITAEGPGGKVSKSFSVRVAPKIVSFEAAKTTVSGCQVAILRWTVRGASTLSIDQGVGIVGVSAYKIVRPLQTTTYTLTAESLGGSDKRSATVVVFPGENAQCRQP
ncbi:MAG: nucleotide exchange factor GrpE [Terriglobia bacterium]|jgi:molecular chaperone GrpE (heat shock protein)